MEQESDYYNSLFEFDAPRYCDFSQLDANDEPIFICDEEWFETLHPKHEDFNRPPPESTQLYVPTPIRVASSDKHTAGSALDLLVGSVGSTPKRGVACPSQVSAKRGHLHTTPKRSNCLFYDSPKRITTKREEPNLPPTQHPKASPHQSIQQSVTTSSSPKRQLFNNNCKPATKSLPQATKSFSPKRQGCNTRSNIIKATTNCIRQNGPEQPSISKATTKPTSTTSHSSRTHSKPRITKRVSSKKTENSVTNSNTPSTSKPSDVSRKFKLVYVKSKVNHGVFRENSTKASQTQKENFPNQSSICTTNARSPLNKRKPPEHVQKSNQSPKAKRQKSRISVQPSKQIGFTPEDEMGENIARMLAEHNKQFTSKTKYAPQKHSVKDIKEWEIESGKQWYSLSTQEREEVNQELSKRAKAARC